MTNLGNPTMKGPTQCLLKKASLQISGTSFSKIFYQRISTSKVVMNEVAIGYNRGPVWRGVFLPRVPIPKPIIVSLEHIAGSMIQFVESLI